MILAILSLSLLLQSFSTEVIEHAQAGAAAQKEGHYDVAIREFSKVTELQPNLASGHANLGDAYFQKGNYRAAIPELEAALRIDPKLLGTHQALGVALLLEGNALAALPHLEQAHTPELLGLAYLETGRLGAAILAFQAALGRNPGDPDLLYYYGRATAIAGDKTFRQLIAIDPQLANGTPGEGRPLRDVATLETELAKSPNDPELLYDFHRAAELESKKSFDQILEKNAATARAYQVRAERAVQSKNFREAEGEYAEAIRLKPFTGGVHLALGDLYASEGKWSLAITQYRAEAQLRPQDVDALYRLGAALLQQGQAGEALAIFADADRLRPNTPEILLEMGNAAAVAKDDSGAQTYWLKVLTIDQKSAIAAQAHMALAGLYKSAGKSAEADRELAAYRQLTGQGK